MEITIHGDASFMICNEFGDIQERSALGYYWNDTRFLHRYEMKLDGLTPSLLDAHSSGYYSAHFLRGQEFDHVQTEPLGIVRKRRLARGLHEDIEITNYGLTDSSFSLSFLFNADFAHIFEVKGIVEGETSACPQGSIRQTNAEDGRSITLSSIEDGARRATTIEFTEKPELDPKAPTAVFRVTLPPEGEWHLGISVSAEVSQEGRSDSTGSTAGSSQRAESGEERRLRHQSYLLSFPRLDTDHDTLRTTYRQSIRDIADLRIKGEDIGAGEFVLAAGIPWFMAVFGRDSLITAIQTLPYQPELARSVLRFMARHQGTKVDLETSEQPGKILHEYRFGPLTGCRRVIPRMPYYGSVDSTPLFLITLSEYYRVTGDLSLALELRDNINQAIAWMRDYGDRDGDGYIEYLREGTVGLANQGWKDSGGAIRFSDGTFPDAPIALCEVQGYAYDALVRTAELYDAFEETEQAAGLRAEASVLREKFNTDFWMADHGYYATGLDADKRQIDSITSNPGHLLWSGIAEREKATLVANRLLSGEMFSGWGVRTMSINEASYNPTAYQNGAVWPHDNSIIATGLAKYGFVDESLTVILATLAAVSRFPGNRAPELFCGYSRVGFDFPVAYPTACSPQAWSAGSIMLMLTTLLGLDIQTPAKRIILKPLPPLPGIIGLEVSGLHAGTDKLDIKATSTTDRLEFETVHAPSGFTVQTQ